MELIEVDVITSNKAGNTVLAKEAIACDDIRSFRPWHKGDKDKEIVGEITLIVLKSGKPSDSAEVTKTRQMHINESYDDFMGRMRTKVIVK
jgi:hypothetical protein